MERKMGNRKAELERNIEKQRETERNRVKQGETEGDRKKQRISKQTGRHNLIVSFTFPEPFTVNLHIQSKQIKK